MRGSAADEAFADVVADACESAGLTLDGRLGALAEVLARASQGARQAPSYASVSHQARRVGLVEPTPEVWVASGPSTRALSRSLVEQVHSAVARGHLTHCGAGAVSEGGGVVIALALSGRFLTLNAPIPQRVSPGAQLVLRGKLAQGYRSPGLAVTHPDGRVSRQELGDSAAIAHTLELPEQGAYSIELLAQGPQGVTVVANFPVGVGVDANQRPQGDDGPGEASAQEVAEKLLVAIAAERKSRGLAPLKIDERLTQLSLAHCEDMLQHNFIAHTSPSTGEASDRVRRAGLTAIVVLENIGRGYSAQEIHQGLMESPGHRGNILHPDAREIGVGVVAEPEGTRTAFIATEVFTRLAREVDVASAPGEITHALQARRKRAKVTQLTVEPKLNKAAQSAADAYASRLLRDERALLDRAVKEVGTAPKGVHAIAAALVLADDVDQVGESARLLDPTLVAMGVGVARLSREQDEHAFVVIFLLGVSK